jgi:hypothetical protein
MHPDPGYSVIDAVFGRSAMADVCDALTSADLHRTRAGARRVLAIPAVRALAAHPDLVSLAEAFVGAGPIPFRATLFDKFTKTRCHEESQYKRTLRGFVPS